ncbi:MAG: hypothetical protein QM499_02990 [Flavobacteriaceae bacterium]
MTTLKIQNIVCPHCQNKMYTIGVMSFIIRNSEVFSDGKIISDPPRPKEQNILICSNCYEAFWKEDAISEDENSETQLGNLPEANGVNDLFPRFESDYKIKITNYYNELLLNGFAKTEKKEVYLRLELWRSLNDFVRYNNESIPSQFKVLFNSNLKRLLEVYKPLREEEKLLQIEMYRELGEFNKAFQFIELISRSEDNQAFLLIKNAVEKNNATVFKL